MDPPLRDGARLPTTDHAAVLPATREAYRSLVVFSTTQGGIQIAEPGTGPDDPPRLVRTLRLPNAVTSVQLADDGFLWAATPDDEGGSLRVFYVIDPHAAIVQRVVHVPQTLRAVASLSVGTDKVYVRAWRNGFSGAVGVVSRKCATRAEACDVRLLADFGNVGLTPERGLHLEPGALYAFNAPNSRDERASTVRLDPHDGRVVAEQPFSGNVTHDDEHFYMIARRAPGTASLVRLIKADLREEAARAIHVDSFQLAYEDGKVYVTNGLEATVTIHDAATLEPIETLDVSSAVPPGRHEPGVGFLAPGVLMLTHRVWLNTRTQQLVLDVFPLNEGYAYPPRFAQGHPWAY